MSEEFLRVAMQPRLFEGRTIATPLVRARLAIGSVSTLALDALIDTGSLCTLASLALAPSLGLTREALEACKTTRIVGVGGDTQIARLAHVDLQLFTTSPRAQIALPGTRVWFMRGMFAGVPLLLGQDGVLEHLTLVQRNHAPAPEFVLRRP